MIGQKELEEILGYKLTDEQWKENQKIFERIQEENWEKDHPMDE